VGQAFLRFEQADFHLEANESLVELPPLGLGFLAVGGAGAVHPVIDLILDAVVVRRAHEDVRVLPRAHASLPLRSSVTSSRRKGSTSVTMPTVCMLPRSMSLVTVAGLMSMQATLTQAGRRLPVAIECSAVATMRQKPTLLRTCCRMASWALMTSVMT